MENDLLDNPEVNQYFHVSAELAVTLDTLVNRGATLREETDQKNCVRTCAKCSFLEEGRCGICGCGINLRSWVSSMHCPTAKW